MVDPNTVRRIVSASGVGPQDHVLEIGPGLGSLTLGLAARARRVTAVEIDAGFVTALDEVLAGLDHVVVVHADALATDVDALVSGAPVRVVANLPYNVATPLLFHLLAAPSVVDLYVMVQREVGERWQAAVGRPLYAGVSLKLALQATAAVELTVPRAVFHPVPNVDSVMVRVTRRADAPDRTAYQRQAALVDAAFAQRRKTLRNNLRTVVAGAILGEVAEVAGVDLGARAETLDVAAIEGLDAALVAVLGVRWSDGIVGR